MLQPPATPVATERPDAGEVALSPTVADPNTETVTVHPLEDDETPAAAGPDAKGGAARGGDAAADRKPAASF